VFGDLDANDEAECPLNLKGCCEIRDSEALAADPQIVAVIILVDAEDVSDPGLAKSQKPVAGPAAKVDGRIGCYEGQQNRNNGSGRLETDVIQSGTVAVKSDVCATGLHRSKPTNFNDTRTAIVPDKLVPVRTTYYV
jgi:hypothetical protein